MKFRRQLIVIAAVVAVVVAAALLWPCVGSKPPGPKAWTRMVVDGFARAAQDYRHDCGDYPTDSEGLNALLVRPANPSWRGPYLRGEGAKQDPVDAWNNPLRYILTNGTPLVVSAGPDQTFETSDDMQSEQGTSNQ